MNIKQRKKVHIQVTKKGFYLVAIPKWIIEDVWGSKKGDILEWDIKEGNAILRRVER